MMEMKAVQLALNAFLPGITVKLLVLMSHNAAEMMYIKVQWGTISLDMFRLAQPIFEWAYPA